MTISRAEVIASVERRRRWSQDEKERLVAASLEPGASSSEVARMAGLHVNQLFRWRKELCKHGEASTAPFVPLEIGPSEPPREVAEVPLKTTAARRRKSQGIIEFDLGSGHRIRSMATLMGTRYVAFSILWHADDPGSDGRASVQQATRTCAEAFRRWHFKCRSCCARTRSAVICSCSVVAEAIL